MHPTLVELHTDIDAGIVQTTSSASVARDTVSSGSAAFLQRLRRPRAPPFQNAPARPAPPQITSRQRVEARFGRTGRWSTVDVDGRPSAWPMAATSAGSTSAAPNRMDVAQPVGQLRDQDPLDRAVEAPRIEAADVERAAAAAAPVSRSIWPEIKFYGTFVLHRRVVLHA